MTLPTVSPDDIPVSVTQLVYTAPKIESHRPSGELSQNQAAEMLAHYWPAIEAHIREQVAREIDAAADRVVGHAELAMRGRCLGLRAGARIARGETYDQKVERLRMDGARELSRRHAARGEQQ